MPALVSWAGFFISKAGKHCGHDFHEWKYEHLKIVIKLNHVQERLDMFISVSEVLVQLKKILKFLDLLYLQNWLFMFYIKTNQRLANSLVDLRLTTTTAIYNLAN